MIFRNSPIFFVQYNFQEIAPTEDYKFSVESPLFQFPLSVLEIEK